MAFKNLFSAAALEVDCIGIYWSQGRQFFSLRFPAARQQKEAREAGQRYEREDDQGNHPSPAALVFFKTVKLHTLVCGNV